MVLALDHIKVVDFTQVIAGPLATRQLAMLGAEVIKIESPGQGDVMRHVMAEGEFSERGFSPIHQYLNAGKKSLVLNLKDQRGQAIARQLAAQADILVENFRPGVMGRLGLDAKSLHGVNPGLIYCSISGYGRAGPKAQLAAYDGPLQADAGLMSVNGFADGDPIRIGVMAVDSLVGANAATAILAALVRRQTSGCGQVIDISMFESALHLMAPQVLDFFNCGAVPTRTGNKTAAGLPTDDLFAAADEPILITAINEAQIGALFDVVGRGDLKSDRRACTPQARQANGVFVRDALSEALEGDTAGAWETRLRAAGIPCARVRTVPQALVDPQVEANLLMSEAVNPGGFNAPPATVLGPGYRAAPDGPRIGPAPLLGAHTRSVLERLGYGEPEIDQLGVDGVV